MKTNPTQGIIYVATVLPRYYGLAVVSCRSLKENYPDCHVTLFTHEDWVDEHADIFDDVITEDVPAHKRTKMWAMARTPYDRTLYLDVDSLILNNDVKNIFDQINDDEDFCYVGSMSYTTSDPKWSYIDIDQTQDAPIDGSFMLYNKSDLMIDFLNTWFEEYKLQQQYTPENWPFEFAYYDWYNFDMFTIWRMLIADWSKFPNTHKQVYEKFRELKFRKIDKRFNGVPFIAQRQLNGRRVIIQIPISEYGRWLPFEWQKVQDIMENKDEKYSD